MLAWHSRTTTDPSELPPVRTLDGNSKAFCTSLPLLTDAGRSSKLLADSSASYKHQVQQMFAFLFIFSSSTVLDTFCLYGSLFQQRRFLIESASGSHPTIEISKAGSSQRSRTSSTPRADTLERSEPLNHRRILSKADKASFFLSLLGLLKDSWNSGILGCLPLLFLPSSDPMYSAITNLKYLNHFWRILQGGWNVETIAGTYRQSCVCYASLSSSPSLGKTQFLPSERPIGC